MIETPVGADLAALAEARGDVLDPQPNAEDCTLLGLLLERPSKGTSVRVTYLQWKRRFVCDIRLWAPHPRTGEINATRKGVMLPISAVPELIAMLQTAVAMREAR